MPLHVGVKILNYKTKTNGNSAVRDNKDLVAKCYINKTSIDSLFSSLLSYDYQDSAFIIHGHPPKHFNEKLDVLCSRVVLCSGSSVRRHESYDKLQSREA